MADELIGKTFGAYTLTELIGRGGMAAVYRGYQQSIDRSVAVKILPAGWLSDPNFSQRFIQEARTLAKLTHPAILPLYEFGEANGVPYIVMPLMINGSLADKLRHSTGFSPAETVHILAPIAEGLDFAHSQGVLHRDVKPNNVLFDQRGAALLADFGIAKSLEGGMSLTGTGVVGTPDYMSPEQARGDTLDARTDLYALGVVAYQMLTGQVVFRATTPMGVIFKHITDAPPPPRQLRPDLSEAVEQVLLKALSKAPDDRYQSGKAFVQSLAAAAGITPATFAAEYAPTQPVQPKASAFEMPAVTATPSATSLPTPTLQPPPPPTGTVSPVGTPLPPPPPPTAGFDLPHNAPPAAPPKSRFGRGVILGVVIGVVVVCLACVACFSVLVVMRDDSTATPTGEVARPTATEVADTTEIPATQILVATEPPSNAEFSESFTDNANGWPTGFDDGPYASGTREITDDVYRWSFTTKDDVFWAASPKDETSYADFDAFLLAQLVEGPATSDFGLIIRQMDAKNFYYFAVNNQQQYSFWVKVADKWTALVPWTQTDVLTLNDTNALSVKATGNEFILTINGEIVNTVTDDNLSSGGVGVAVEVFDKDVAAVIEFDELYVTP